MPSSISFYHKGDLQENIDIEGRLELRKCTDDRDYPYEIHGVTKGGHEFFLDITAADWKNIILSYLKEDSNG